jgi:uncharacterized protein (DUF1697 family)
MKELVAILESLGCQKVRTYIQSGNAVFQYKPADAKQLASKVTAVIKKKRGFAPHVHVLGAQQLAKVVQANPFPEAESEPKSLHVWFLAEKPTKAGLTALEALKSKSEQLELQGTAFYLHAPDGIGRSKLAAAVERHLGVAATARNWRTVCAILKLTGESA